MDRERRDSFRKFGLMVISFVALSLSGCQSSIRMDETGSESAIDESGKIPAKAFFGNPLFRNVRLSPNGRRIAALISREQNDVLMSIDLVTGERIPLTVLERKESSRSLASQAIVGVGWASNDIVVMSVSRPKLGPGFVRRQTTLAASHVGDPRARDLGKDWPHSDFLTRQDEVISFLPDEPDRVLINWFGEARRVDLQFSRLRGSEFKKRGVGSWRVDHEFKVRIGFSGERWTNEFEVWGRISEDDRMEKLVKWDPLDIEEAGVGFRFAGFSEKPEMIYIWSERETGRFALYEYDLLTREIGRTVFEHPEYEINSIRRSKVDGRLLSVTYVEDRPVTHYVDAKYRRLWQPIHQDFAGKTLSVVTTDRQSLWSRRTISLLSTIASIISPGITPGSSGRDRVSMARFSRRWSPFAIAHAMASRSTVMSRDPSMRVGLPRRSSFHTAGHSREIVVSGIRMCSISPVGGLRSSN